MRLEASLALGAFTLLAGALAVVAVTGQARGYEISIYDAYPSYFWGLLLASYALGLFVLVRQALAQEGSGWWIAGLAVLIVANSLLILLPFFRGYAYFGWGDNTQQVGHIRDIQNTGRLAAPYSAGENFYPALHVHTLALGFSGNLDPEVLAKILPAYFFALYVLWMHLLAARITPVREGHLLITALAALPLIIPAYGEPMASFIPRMAAFELAPLILYLLYRSRGQLRSSVYAVPLVVMLLTLPVWHPGDGGPFLILSFLVLGLSDWLRKKISVRNRNPVSVLAEPQQDLNIFNPIFVLFAVWLAWYASFFSFSISVRSFKLWLAGDLVIESNMYLASVGRAGMPLFDAVLLLLKRTAHLWPYFAVATIGSVASLRGALSRGRSTSTTSLAFALFFLLFAGIWAFLTLGWPVGSHRPLPYAVLASAVVSALTLCRFVRWLEPRSRTVAPGLITCLLLIPLAFGVFNLYPSPWKMEANSQVTVADRVGTAWLLRYQNEGVLVEDATFSVYSIALALRGWKAMPGNLPSRESIPPEYLKNLGYQGNASLGAGFKADRYLALNKKARIQYLEALPRYSGAWRWTPEDLRRLDGDPTVQRIYSSGGFDVFYVNGRGIKGL